jgi:hypothetical protein
MFDGIVMDVIKVILVMPFVTKTMPPIAALPGNGGQIPFSLFRLRIAEIRSSLAMLMESYDLAGFKAHPQVPKQT